MIIGIIAIFLNTNQLRRRGNVVSRQECGVSRANSNTCHTGVVGHFITMVSTFSWSWVDVTKGNRRPAFIHVFHRNGLELPKISPQGKQEIPMTFGPKEAAIDEIVASCNGDLRGALKALLMVNEHLEAEIAQLYAAAAQYGITERGNNALH
jgi:hypothetical protein